MGRIRNWARAMKRDVVVLWLAARDPRVPWYVKLLAGAVAAYALSPIDLIPDFIPVIGYLDDLIIVPLGVMAVAKLIPAPLLVDLREQASMNEKPKSLIGAFVIIGLWLAGAAAIYWYVWPRWRIP